MKVMNEAERKRFLDTLRSDDEFRATVRRELLTEELLNLPQTVATLVDVVAQQRQDFTALAVDVHAYMERTIALLGEGFSAVRGEISDLRTSVRGEISDLRTAMESGFTAVESKFDQVNAEIREIKDRLAS